MRTLIIGLVVAVSTAACGVSTQEEVQLGAEYSAQINQQLPIVQDLEINRYVNVLGDSISKLADETFIDSDNRTSLTRHPSERDRYGNAHRSVAQLGECAFLEPRASAGRH
jgi:hypothetical protein